MNKYLCIWDYPFITTITKIVKAKNKNEATNIFTGYIDDIEGLIADVEDIKVLNLDEIELIN